MAKIPIKPQPLKVVYKTTAELIPFVNNSRTHSEQQIQQVAASIKEFGFTNPILIDENNGIIAGHGRLLAAQLLKLTEVPTITLSGLSDAQRRAYIIADNKLALNAGWDEQLLGIEITDLKDVGFDIDLLGFTDDELSGFMGGELNEGLTDEDAVPDVPEEPVTVLGDIYKLGNHRLMCGDSTSIDAVEKLMDGVKADMVFTDPPYGINEKGDRSKRGGLAQGGNFKDFKDDTNQYAIDAYNLCDALKIPRQVWWGANYYCHSMPQSNNWFIWDKRVEEKQKDTQSDCEMAWVKSEYSSIRIFRHLWKGMMKDSERGKARVHPTQKPIALAEWSFDYFKNVLTVLDLFGGSGSTMIACEKTKRNCLMMEFEPVYCDVIVKRWEDFTGNKAELVRD
tara:strand:- start:407 stop:1591 length:1185 start_codon:yes stop_codon:yes gene_type:complete